MSYSQAAICNIALGHLGINRLITDLDADRSAQGQACRTHYDLALEVTLKAYRWPFAQRSATLALLSGYVGTVWHNAYRAPSDFLLAHCINRLDIDPIGERYEVGGDASGVVIYTNADEAVLDYTARITTPNLYPSDFVEALAYQLAIRTAQPLAAEQSLRASASRGFSDAITLALTSAGNESRGQEQPGDDYLSARGLSTEP